MHPDDEVKPPEFPEPHPSVLKGNDPNLQFFEYGHLPPHLQEISKPFGEMAKWMCWRLPWGPQRDLAILLLLQSKDAAVRTTLAKK